MSLGHLHKNWFALGCTWTGLLIKREQRQANKNVTYILNKQNDIRNNPGNSTLRTNGRKWGFATRSFYCVIKTFEGYANPIRPWYERYFSPG